MTAFDMHADRALAIIAQTPTRPSFCRCPGTCEGGPECVDPDEGFPLPKPSPSDCWRCQSPGWALRHDGAVYCRECAQGTPGVYGPLAPAKD